MMTLTVTRTFFLSVKLISAKRTYFQSVENCSFAVCENHAKFKCDTGHELDFFDIEKSVRKEKPRSKKLKIDSENSVVEPLCETNAWAQGNTCEIGNCKGEVFVACPHCLRYLCYHHVTTVIVLMTMK